MRGSWKQVQKTVYRIKILETWKFIEKLRQMRLLVYRALLRLLFQDRLVVDRQHAALLRGSIQDDRDVLRDILAKSCVFKFPQPVRVQLRLADDCTESVASELLTLDYLFLRLENHFSEFTKKNHKTNPTTESKNFCQVTEKHAEIKKKSIESFSQQILLSIPVIHYQLDCLSARKVSATERSFRWAALTGDDVEDFVIAALAWMPNATYAFKVSVAVVNVGDKTASVTFAVKENWGAAR